MGMAPDYLIEVRDRDFIRRGQIAPEYQSLMFTEVFRGVGAWEMKLPAEHPLLPELKKKGSGIIVTESWTTEQPQPDGHSDWTEVRRNLATDPGGRSAAGITAGTLGWGLRGWGGQGAGTFTTVTGAVDGPPGTGLTTYVRKTWTADGTLTNTGFDHALGAGTSGTHTTGFPVSPGQVITFSSYIRPKCAPGRSKTAVMQMIRRGPTGAYLGITNGPVATITQVDGTVWTRLSLTYTVPADGSVRYVSPHSDIDAGQTWQVGDLLDGTGLLVEYHNQVRDYFDGYGEDEELLRHEWLGTAGLSQSVVQTRVRVPQPPLIIPHSRVYSGRTNSCALSQDAEDPKGTWTIKGMDDGVLAKATVAYPDPANPADQQSVAYWNLVGDGETVMKEAVRRNAGDLAIAERSYPWLVVPTNLHRGGPASANARFDVLGDLLQALAAQSGLGWTFYQDGSQIVFDVTEPRDRTAFIRLDVETGGLESSELAFGAPTATEVLVLGQGEGADRTVLPVTSPEAEAEATEWALRWETTKDQRNTDDPAELLDAGNEILNESGETTHSLKVTPSDAPGQALNRDWGLGDTVTVVIDGQEAQAIVTQIATAISSEGVIKQATVGDPVGYDWEAKVSSSLRNQAQRIDRLENYIDTAARERIALLDPAYIGPGPAKVQFLDDPSGTLSNEAYYWATPYTPWGSRVVRVVNTNGTWLITGQDGGGDRDYGSVRLTLGSGWTTYNDAIAEHHWAEGPFATRHPSGYITLSGLLRATGSPGDGAIIASGLPVGWRPGYTVIHYLNNSDTAKSVNITPAGELRARGVLATNGYVSLDGIGFWPDGVGDWTPIGQGGSSWGASFGRDATWAATYGEPSFWKDPYGFVWFRGLARVNATVSTDNTPIVAMPATHRVDKEQHFRTTGIEAYAGLGGQPDDGLNWKANSPGNVGAWISLEGVAFATSDALALNTWRPFIGLANSWALYGGSGVSFPTPAITRRGDGLVMTKGMFGGGTLGVGRATTVPREAWPTKGRIIIDTIGNNSRARVDISGVDEIEGQRGKGGLSFINGSNAWASLDGLKWSPII